MSAESPVPDAARAVLSRVRSAARSAQSTPPGGSTAPGGAATKAGFRRGDGQRRLGGRGGGVRYTGPGPDPRDPVRIGGALGDLVTEAGWGKALQGARLTEQWAKIVGPANAEHAVPESLDPQTGQLVIRTTSTAWADQLRLMLPVLHAAIDSAVGSGVVREIRLAGPVPPRVTGRRRVRGGRGPRDTYG